MEEIKIGIFIVKELYEIYKLFQKIHKKHKIEHHNRIKKKIERVLMEDIPTIIDDVTNDLKETLQNSEDNSSDETDSEEYDKLFIKIERLSNLTQQAISISKSSSFSFSSTEEFENSSVNLEE